MDRLQQALAALRAALEPNAKLWGKRIKAVDAKDPSGPLKRSLQDKARELLTRFEGGRGDGSLEGLEADLDSYQDRVNAETDDGDHKTYSDFIALMSGVVEAAIFMEQTPG